MKPCEITGYVHCLSACICINYLCHPPTYSVHHKIKAAEATSTQSNAKEFKKSDDSKRRSENLTNSGELMKYDYFVFLQFLIDNPFQQWKVVVRISAKLMPRVVVRISARLMPRVVVQISARLMPRVVARISARLMPRVVVQISARLMLRACHPRRNLQKIKLLYPPRSCRQKLTG